MPSKKQYNLVHNDDYDTRIPLHSEEAFHRGIVFHAKFIGSLEVPRPTSRVEIVAAMRRIRYEFKAKGIKKKKVTLEVSVDGLKVTLRKKKKKQQWMDENKIFLMNHPIYRIFYVSHDSHDLKIFSYIARDGNSNSFKCNVFKSSKKSQAMRVVRTVGQAFEVCHKLSLNSAPEDRERGINRDGVRDPLNNDDDYEDHDETNSERPPPTPPPVHKDISLLAPAIDAEDTTPEITSSCISRSQEAPVTTASTTPIRQSPSQATMVSECGMLVGGELTALKHEIQLLRERLEQQGQQTRAAVAHARLLQDQLAAETAARIEAQTRTHQLLVQNKELLEHISALVAHLREQERLGGVGHITGPTSQGPQSAPMSTAPTVPDLSTLGQSQRPGGPASPWELDPPSFSYYTYPTETVYTPNTNAVLGSQGFNSSNEQLQFQTQLLERLHNISPYQPQPQRSPYATPSPYPVGPGLLLPPTNNRPSSSAQVSPNSTSLRVSQANSYSPSPVMLQRADNYASSSLESSGEEQQHGATFIKPLPQGQNNPSGFLAPGDIDGTRIKVPSVTDEPPPIVLDPPPPGRRSIPGNKSAGIETANINNGIRTRRDLLDAGGPSNTGIARPQEPQKHLVHFLRTPGPPPSRTTSARLPSRSELMNQVQRTTWARHTTK